MYLGPYQRPAQPCQLHSATAQQSPQGSSMKGLCAVVGIGTTAVLPSVLINVKKIYMKNMGFQIHDIFAQTSLKQFYY